MVIAPTAAPAAGKLGGDLPALAVHLQLDASGEALLARCADVGEALAQFESAGLLMEATRLVAHALPAREAVWWACMCARHTASSGENPTRDAVVREAAEEWVRRQTDTQRRIAMKAAEAAGFGSAEAWAAVAAFWCGDSMSPPEAPKVPPEPHFRGLAASGSVALAAVRGNATLRDGRLKRFLASAREIASGGAGRLEAENA